MRKIDLLVVFLVVILDQTSKVLFSSRVLNTGVAFGLGQNLTWELVSALLLLVIVYMYFQAKNNFEKLGLVLMFASGLSNLIDRFFIGGVRDFVYWPILMVYGNLADVFLVVGVVFILIDYLVMEKKSLKR